MLYHSWCGVSLRSGSMYIAAGFGLFSAVMLTLFSVRLDDISEGIALRASSPEPDGKVKYTQALRAVIVAATVFYALQTAVNLLLLLGAMQENACFLYPWITVYSFVVILNLITCAVVPATFFSHGFSLDGIFAILGSILNIVITFYALGIVYSFCKQMKRMHSCIG